MIGSDPDQLDQLAATMLACADRLDGVRSELAFVLVSSPWRGGDAEDFRWQWGHQLAGMLQGASAAFREAEARVRVNAAQQRHASADDGGGAPIAGRTGGGGGGGGGWGAGDLLAIAAGFGVEAMRWLGYASGAVERVKDAHRGWLGAWAKNASDHVVRFEDSVRLGNSVPLRFAGELLGKVALPVDAVNTAISGKKFVDALQENPRGTAAFSEGVSTVLGAAGVVVGVAALAGAGPAVAGVGLGLLVGGMAWDAIKETPVDDWVNDGLWAMSDGISKAATDVRDFIGGGLNALLGH